MTHATERRRRSVALGLTGALTAVVALLVWAAPASSVSGALYTTVHQPLDGTGHCQNGNPNVNCNIYDGKAYVWLNGGPPGNGLGPNGKYFFAVLEPSGQPDPNDRAVPITDKNLSDEHTTHTQRTFTVTNGEISAYVGPHQYAFDSSSGTNKIRASPYSDTTNNGGVYIMAVCYTGPTGASYPVNPKDCKYDAFKVPDRDLTPPECPDPILGVNGSGQRTATQNFFDAGGIDSIQVLSIINANFTLTNFFIGTAGPAVLQATKINQTQRAFIRILITDVAGNERECDPAVASIRPGAAVQRFTRLDRSDSKVTIRNGRPGVRPIAVIVNGHVFRVLSLRDHQTKRFNVRRAMQRGNRNTIVVRAVGSLLRGRADVMVAN